MTRQNRAAYWHGRADQHEADARRFLKLDMPVEANRALDMARERRELAEHYAKPVVRRAKRRAA